MKTVRNGNIMTPEQKIKKEIVLRAIQDNNLQFEGNVNANNVESLYQNLVDEDLHWDYKNEIRQGQYETGLPAEYSRHYESKSVAMKMSDGTWLGWTYWFGGGKFGEPEAIEWMNTAYPLNYKEEEKVVIVRTFEKK